MDFNGNIIKKEIGSSFPEGLQETYTDFDGWITKWSCKFKQRRPSPVQTAIKKLELDDETNRIAILEDLLVYGFVNNKMAVVKNIVYKLESIKTDDCIHLDYVLMRLLNGNNKLLFVNAKL